LRVAHCASARTVEIAIITEIVVSLLFFGAVAAYFWGGQRGSSGSTPDQSGVLIPDENGG